VGHATMPAPSALCALARNLFVLVDPHLLLR
jgi:hypothetical protein